MDRVIAAVNSPETMDQSQQVNAVSYTGDFLAGRLRDRIFPEDLATLEDAVGAPRCLNAGECLVLRGETVAGATILLEGFMFSRILKDGKRYIVGVHVPGDFVDLHGFIMKRLDHDLVAAGPVRIVQIDGAKLEGITQARPSLMRAMWFSTLLDASINRQWIRNLEGLDAPQRIAHLYAELHHRLLQIGREAARTLRTPFTQSDLADMCGVSAIHANRAVARLREMGLGEIRRGDLYITDWKALERYAGFDPTYLYGDRSSR